MSSNSTDEDVAPGLDSETQNGSSKELEFGSSSNTNADPEPAQPEIAFKPGEFIKQKPNSITCSKSLDAISTSNNNSNNNTRAGPALDSIDHIATPSRKPSFLCGCNHAKVHPTPLVSTKDNEELCLLKTVAPMTDSQQKDDVNLNESITNLIADLNAKGNDNVESAIFKCSDTDSLEGFCRICHDNPSKMTLIAPCSCKGSMGLVHRSCLERWLGESGKQNCEICNTEFVTERRPRYTGCGSVFQWIRNPTTPSDTRNLFFDMACFFILTPLAGISAWLCIVCAQQYAALKDSEMAANRANSGMPKRKRLWTNSRNGNNNAEPTNTTWTSVGLLTLTGTLLAAYYVWLFVAIRYHIQVWREWQRHNYVVTIMPATVSNENGTNPTNNTRPCDGHDHTSTQRQPQPNFYVPPNLLTEDPFHYHSNLFRKSSAGSRGATTSGNNNNNDNNSNLNTINLSLLNEYHSIFASIKEDDESTSSPPPPPSSSSSSSTPDTASLPPGFQNDNIVIVSADTLDRVTSEEFLSSIIIVECPEDTSDPSGAENRPTSANNNESLELVEEPSGNGQEPTGTDNMI